MLVKPRTMASKSFNCISLKETLETGAEAVYHFEEKVIPIFKKSVVHQGTICQKKLSVGICAARNVMNACQEGQEEKR